MDDQLPDPDIQLVPVFETGDAGLTAIVKWILDFLRVSVSPRPVEVAAGRG